MASDFFVLDSSYLFCKYLDNGGRYRDAVSGKRNSSEYQFFRKYSNRACFEVRFS